MENKVIHGDHTACDKRLLLPTGLQLKFQDKSLVSNSAEKRRSVLKLPAVRKKHC